MASAAMDSAADADSGEEDSNVFSVNPRCALCLCGKRFSSQVHHGDTEFTEVAQRLESIPTIHPRGSDLEFVCCDPGRSVYIIRPLHPAEPQTVNTV